jgi:hypothetical protein
LTLRVSLLSVTEVMVTLAWASGWLFAAFTTVPLTWKPAAAGVGAAGRSCAAKVQPRASASSMVLIALLA